jgi:predicted GTPase
VLNNGKALVIAANKMDALEGEEEQQLYLKTLRACMVCMLLLLIGHCLDAFL